LGQLNADEGSKVRVVPRVGNACAGNNVIGVTATNGRALGGLVRALRKARLQLFAVPWRCALRSDAANIFVRSVTGQRCFMMSFT
jgi:hypothetical protein